MIRKCYLISFTIITSILILACNGNKDKPLNPNGDSELAIVMRAMFDDAELLKWQLENNKPINIKYDHSQLLTAASTEPGKSQDPLYQSFANNYMTALESYRKSDAISAHSNYKAMVDMCMTCHQSMCPGPTVKIKKLYLEL